MAATIYLIRHGAAEAANPSGDAARELTEEGRAEFAARARRLAGQLSVTRILHSPAVRARQTAELLAAELKLPLEACAELASGESDGRELLGLARRVGPGCALVGHNPEMAGAIALAATGRPTVPPGTIAAVELTAAGPQLAWIEP